jgi:hypothetical protein
MTNTEAAIIAGLSAFGGGLIVAISNYAVSWLQAREARKAELQRALIELWYVVGRIDHKLRMEPEPGRVARVLNEQMASRFPLLDHATGLLRRRLLEPDLDMFLAEMVKAMAAASLLAPLGLMPAMAALTEVAGGAEGTRGSEWRSKWESARTEYFLQCRELLGSGVVRAATERADDAPSTDPLAEQRLGGR